MNGELNCEKFITHQFDGLEHVNDAIDALHSGKCLRSVIHISKVDQEFAPKCEILENKKVAGGHLKRVKHHSEVNNCDMTFSVYIPEEIRGE